MEEQNGDRGVHGERGGGGHQANERSLPLTLSFQLCRPEASSRRTGRTDKGSLGVGEESLLN